MISKRLIQVLKHIHIDIHSDALSPIFAYVTADSTFNFPEIDAVQLSPSYHAMTRTRMYILICKSTYMKTTGSRQVVTKHSSVSGYFAILEHFYVDLFVLNSCFCLFTLPQADVYCQPTSWVSH